MSLRMELISFLVEFLTQRRRGAEGVGERRVRSQGSGSRSQELEFRVGVGGRGQGLGVRSQELESGVAREGDAVAGEEADAALEPQ